MESRSLVFRFAATHATWQASLKLRLSWRWSKGRKSASTPCRSQGSFDPTSTQMRSRSSMGALASQSSHSKNYQRSQPAPGPNPFLGKFVHRHPLFPFPSGPTGHHGPWWVNFVALLRKVWKWKSTRRAGWVRSSMLPTSRCAPGPVVSNKIPAWSLAGIAWKAGRDFSETAVFSVPQTGTLQGMSPSPEPFLALPCARHCLNPWPHETGHIDCRSVRR